MSKTIERPDPAQPDLYWSGHSGFAMLPGLVVGVLMSTIFMLGALPLADWLNLREDWTVFVRFWVVLIGWTIAGIVWIYRAASLVYRLTPSYLYVDYGMLYRPVAPIPLTSVVGVECRAWLLRRLFCVGSVIIHIEGRKPVRLHGICRPEKLVEAIQSAVAKTRGG